MRKAFRITITSLAGLTMAWHFDGALDHLGYGRRWGRFLNSLPSWIDGLLGDKWVLAAATMVIGMVLADYLVRRSIKVELTPDRWRYLWLNYKRSMLLLKIRHAWIPQDLRYELQTMDRALRSAGVELPSLPTIDPRDPAIRDTEAYLRAIGTLSDARMPEARRIAELVVRESTRAEADPPRHPGRFATVMRRLFGRD